MAGCGSRDARHPSLIGATTIKICSEECPVEIPAHNPQPENSETPKPYASVARTSTLPSLGSQFVLREFGFRVDEWSAVQDLRVWDLDAWGRGCLVWLVFQESLQSADS